MASTRIRAATPPVKTPATASLPLALRRDPTSDPKRWLAAGGKPTCQGCVAHCCRYITVEIDKPEAKWQYDQIYWMLLHQDVSVYQELSGEWFVEFTTRCSALNERNLCSIYEDRPQLCRDYSNESCQVWNNDPLYKVHFADAESFARYLDEKGVNWRYKRERPRVRVRLTMRRPKAGPPGENIGENGTGKRRAAGRTAKSATTPRTRAASGGTGPRRGRSPRG